MNGSGAVSWASPLGLAVLGFLASSVVYALIALGRLVLTHRYGVGRVPSAPSIFLSPTIESDLLGRPPAEMLAASPGLSRILGILMDCFLGMMAGFAILLAAVAWFGLHDAQAWALWAAALGNVALLAVYWGVAIGPFMREAGVGYFELWHPFALFPTVLVPIATVLGVIGLRT